MRSVFSVYGRASHGGVWELQGVYDRQDDAERQAQALVAGRGDDEAAYVDALVDECPDRATVPERLPADRAARVVAMFGRAPASGFD